MTKPAVDHVMRDPLPWRDVALTECGLVPGANTLSRDQFAARINDLGQQRAAMVTCMTCFNTVRNWPTWLQDPAKRLARDAYRPSGPEYEQLNSELIAMAALVEAHRDEFDAMMAGLEETASFADAARRRRAHKLGGRS